MDMRESTGVAWEVPDEEFYESQLCAGNFETSDFHKLFLKR